MSPHLGNRARHQRLLAAADDATQAASIHNSQPWRFVLSPHRVEVWLDLSHRPTIIDSSGRWALLSVGAALANLELGVRCHVERSATVELTAVPPSTSQVAGSSWLEQLATRPVAVVTVGDQPDPPQPAETALHDAVADRHTSRRPSAGAVGEGVLRAVVQAAGTSATSADVELLVTDDDQTDSLLGLAIEADQGWRNDVAYLAEVEGWAGREDGLGIPAGSIGPKDTAGRYAGRDFAVGVSGAKPAPPAEHFEERPELVAVLTGADGHLDWLRAGAAMQRLMLAATAAGLEVGVLGQVVEQDSFRARAHALFGGRRNGHLQQVLRLGRKDVDRDTPPPTPRRSVDSVVTWRA